MKKLNFALVGCGRISKKHFEALKNNSNKSNLVAVCDIIEKRAKNASEENNCDYYTSLLEMLKRNDIDAVSISTPSGYHPEHGRMIASSGRHVLVEKPIGVGLEDVKSLIKTCKKESVQLHVIHQNRFNNTISYLKKAIDENRFGKIYNVQSNVFWTRFQEYYDSDDWKGTWKLDGGAFMNQAIHYVDLLVHLIGDVSSVMAYAKTQARKIEAYDSGVVALDFKNGAMGSMNVSMLTYPKNLEGSFTIIGEKGTVKIGGVALNKIEVWDFKDKNKDDEKVFEQSYDTKSVYGFGHTKYYNIVIDCIVNNKQPFIDGNEGIKALKLVSAIHQSSKENKRIYL